MNCHELDNLLFPWLDGEFSASERAELELHLAGCADCAARVERERRVHDALRARAHAQSPAATEALRERLRAGLDQEVGRARRAHLVPRLALAAGVLVAAAASYQSYRGFRARLYLDDVAARHARHFPLEIERATPAQLQAWFGGKLDHPVAVPSFPNSVAAGARLLNVREKQAAYIRYDTGARGSELPGMGLFVYSDAPGDVDVPTLPEVALSSSHGFNVVSARDGDLVYTLVTDTRLDDVEELRQVLQRGLRARAPAVGPAAPQLRPVSLQR